MPPWKRFDHSFSSLCVLLQIHPGRGPVLGPIRRAMRVLLVHLPNGDVSEPGQPLGPRAQVAARIVELLPGTVFQGGLGSFRRRSYAIIFRIEGDEPTAVDVEVDHDEGLSALRRIVDKTGWHVIDPSGPFFVDLAGQSDPAPSATSPQAPASYRQPARAEGRTQIAVRSLSLGLALVVLLAFVGVVVPWIYKGGISRVLASAETEASISERRGNLTRTIDQIRGCIDKYEASHPDRGFPPGLEQLGPNGDHCLSAGVAGGQEAGYQFAYFPGVANAAGAIQIYSLCARPAKFPANGKDTLVASPRTGTRLRTPDQPDSADSYTCAEAYDDAVAAIQHCVTAHAAAHPQTGYPATLADVHSCVMGSGVTDVRTHSIQQNGLRYMYIAGTPDDRGMIARFEIYGVSRASYAGAARVWSDETGAVRIGHAQELPSPFDPLEQEDRKAASESQERNKLGAAEMQTRCDAGDQEWCLHLAAYQRKAAEELIAQGQTADIPSIVKLYSAACDAGAASACASLGDFYLDGKIVRANLVKAGPLLDRACTLGDGDACHRFATLLRESSTQEDADYAGRRQRAATLDQRGCELRSGGSCLTLAEFYGQGGAPSRARAETLFEDSCRMGVAEACHRLAGIRDNDQRLLLKACASGGFAECPELNPLAGQQ